jgi:copper oxidase (laccase) domain-containing protein
VSNSVLQVVTIYEPFSREDAPQCDGLVTSNPGIALAILGADCAPLLLADPIAGVVGAAHCGWKGLAAGIVPVRATRVE